MAKRVITAVILTPVVVGLVILGGMWLRLALLLLSLVGLHELFKAVSGKILPVHFAAFLFAILHFLMVVEARQEYMLIALSAFVLSTIALTVMCFNKIKLTDILVTIAGFFYVPFLFSFIYLIRDHNIYFVWLIFISASVSDTVACLVGRVCGRHKMTGSPSPNKSWEGCIGGVIGAAFTGLVYGLVVIRLTDLSQSMIFYAMAIAVMGAVFSQIGDFFASAIKRSVGIKDFGKLLPGHGGVLDRFDSIIAAAPVVYIVMIGIEYLWM